MSHVNTGDLESWIMLEPYNPDEHGPWDGVRTVKMHMLDLLFQQEWWQPQRGPAVRILDMTDTHRWHTLRWLERRAASLKEAVAWSYATGPQPSGDAACDAFEWALLELDRTEPLTWLRSTELHEALGRRLPTPHAGKRSRKQWGRMVQRARHWSTCPRNRHLRAEECTCRKPGAAQVRAALTASSGLSV
jgi:hypothetical protein